MLFSVRIVGALFAWMGLAINLEYGCALPRSGGDVVYLEFVYRRPRFLATTLIAVQSVLLGFTASNCIVFAEYVLFAKGGEATRFEMKLLAAGLLTTVIIIHSCKSECFVYGCAMSRRTAANATIRLRLSEGWHLHPELPWLDQNRIGGLHGLYRILCSFHTASGC